MDRRTEILDLLIHEGKMTRFMIAREIGVHPDYVREIMKGLRKRGVIATESQRCNPHKTLYYVDREWMKILEDLPRCEDGSYEPDIFRNW